MSNPIKFCFSLVFSLLISLTFLHGQQSGFGIKGGINISNQKFTTDGLAMTPEALVKPHLGLFYNTMIGDQFSFQNEILYSSQSSGKLNVGFENKGLTYHYLNLPIIFKYYPSEFLKLHSGLQIDMLIGGDEVY